VKQLTAKIRAARRVYVIGNGGSGANASHIVNDLLSCGVRAFDINQAFFSATANDCGYEVSFARWLRIVGEPGDLLIALSGSGTSPNIVRAMRAAKDIGMESELVTDYLRTMDMQASEERQIEIGHHLMRELKCEQH
jgi:D-sedoheptulose 7-phosphate isomerase